MAKKDYPGLVIVPPSDRTILRRRVLRLSLLLIPVIWITWTLIGSPPVSQKERDCQDATTEDTPGNPAVECGASHQETATLETREKDTPLTHVSQTAENPAERQHSIPSPTPENHRPSPEPRSQEDPTPKPSAVKDPPPDRTGTPSRNEKAALRPPAKKSTSVLTPDAQLAEQGDAFAQYRLGKYYAKHRGRETPESISWYRKASTGLRRLAEAGNGQAMYVLGIMYAYGRGVARNTDEARHWLSLAVRQNVTEAQMVLASLEVKQTGSHQRKDRGPTHTAVP